MLKNTSSFLRKESLFIFAVVACLFFAGAFLLETQPAQAAVATDLFDFIGVVGGDFDKGNRKDWTQAEMDEISRATVEGAATNATWKNIVFGPGKVRLERKDAHPDCLFNGVNVCSGFAPGVNTLYIYDNFFPSFNPSRTFEGQKFIMAHELMHLLQNGRPDPSGVWSAFQNDNGIRQDLINRNEAAIRSYPFCQGVPYGGNCSGVNAQNEDFAEASAAFIAKRDVYTPADFNFQNDYPEHHRFARDTLYGGTGGPGGTPGPGGTTTFTAEATAVITIGNPPGCKFNSGGQDADRETPCGWPISGTISQNPYECNPSHCDTPGMGLASSMDIAAFPQNVYATHDGVAFVGTSSSSVSAGGTVYPEAEKFVLIRSGKYETLYSHLLRPCITNGQTVTRGTPIGVSDNTGVSGGHHLHYEIRKPSSLTLAQLEAGNHPPGTAITLAEFNSVVPSYPPIDVTASYSAPNC